MSGYVGINAVGDDVDRVGIELIFLDHKGFDVLADGNVAPAPEGEGAHRGLGVVEAVRGDGEGGEACAAREHAADEGGDATVRLNDVESAAGCELPYFICRFYDRYDVLAVEREGDVFDPGGDKSGEVGAARRGDADVVTAFFERAGKGQYMCFRAPDTHSGCDQKYSQSSRLLAYNISLYIITYFKGKINKKGKIFSLKVDSGKKSD